MARHLRICFFILAASLIVSGCVSTGKFKKMEADKNQEISALQKDKASLEQQKSTLEKQVGDLDQQKSTLEKQKSDLEQQKAATQQQVASLEQEKASLMASGQQQQKQYDELVQNLSQEVEKGQLQVTQYKNMLAVNLAEQIFFDSGKATLKKGGKEVLKKVGDVLKGYQSKAIMVVGHTDNVPVAKALQAQYPSNWELSVARATNVVRYLQEVGVPPERMISSGRAEYDPLAPNDTPEGRQKNRRIGIMLIDKSMVSEITGTN
ncbi:MAG TPA: OmpA family protein [Nitrospirota bacterium]|nr:OmpA family protein [Nitrospirota bacterium]